MIMLNGSPVTTTMFPDNTSQVWKLPEWILNETNFANITWEYSHEGEFMQLAQLKALLDTKSFKTCLKIMYLPYGRQDKNITNNTTFALTVFAHLLNELRFDEIKIFDPHSSVATKLIYNSEAIYPVDMILNLISKLGSDLLCFPDKGALEKYAPMFKVPYVYGEKDRDQLTGFIKKYDLVGDVKGKSVLVVDDICDGGMTFKLLADALMGSGAKEVSLFVSHGIFSKGLKTLRQNKINRIFTKDGEASEVQNQIAYRRI